jgi:hypothetical protein
MGAPGSRLPRLRLLTHFVRSIARLLLPRATELSPLRSRLRNVSLQMNLHTETSVPLRRFNYYVEGRVFEWTMAVSMLVGGIEIVAWPELVSFGLTPWMVTIVPQIYVGLFMMAVGWLRVSGLMLNGQTIMDVIVGPYVRAVCAILSSSLWVQFAFTLIVISYETSKISVGIPFWTMFTFSELYVAYRAAKNVR